MEYEAKWPAVVLEVGISETTSKLYKDAEWWLEGTIIKPNLWYLLSSKRHRDGRFQTIIESHLKSIFSKPIMTGSLIIYSSGIDLRIFGFMEASSYLYINGTAIKTNNVSW